MKINRKLFSKQTGSSRKATLSLKRLFERKKLFLKYGYDLDKERNTILDEASPLSGKILETGTGKGHFAVALAKQGVSFISVDISREDLVIAKEHLKFYRLGCFADLRIQNGGQLGFKDKSFDMVFSINALHHFEQPLNVLTEFIRVLKPGGRLIISDFTDKGFQVMDKIHALDGNIHDRGKVTLPEAATYLRKKKFHIRKSATSLHQTIIAEKPR